MSAPRIWEPDFLFRDGRLVAGEALGVDEAGLVCDVASLPPRTPCEKLPGRALLPGLVNAHSHAFQRLIRGRTELRSAGGAKDDFWSWRELMYQAAERLTPDTLHVAARQTFVEMARAGITTVGEFHYLHHQADGTPYAEPNELALAVVRAAREVGLRITLLRVGYARPGFKVAPNPRQRRFQDGSVEQVLARTEALARSVAKDSLVKVGLAPHSVRAVPREWLEQLAVARGTMPVHMHVSEQPAELAACVAEHGKRPVELLDSLGLLDARFTAVHAIHLEQNEVEALGRARAFVCACPSTEMNLGDGIIPADLLARAGARLCLGSDSQAEIDVLSEARQLEGHLRLLRQQRVVLDDGEQGAEGLAAKLLASATTTGAASLGWSDALLTPGSAADFFTLDLEHPSLAGANRHQLLSAAVFASVPGAVADVVVQGRRILEQGHHPLERESGRAFGALAEAVFA